MDSITTCDLVNALFSVGAQSNDSEGMGLQLSTTGITLAIRKRKLHIITSHTTV